MKKSNGTILKRSEIKKIIFTEVPRLIKKDPEIREFILRISSEKFADKKKTEDRIDKLIEELRIERLENQKKWEENQKRWKENQKKWEENQKRWEENQKVINSILNEIKLLHKKYDTSIGAIGARWGLRAEGSFREAIKGILEENFPVKVERYKAFDEEGFVFGKPDQIELDLIIKDGFVVVAEIKSSISKEELATFLRKVKIFEKKEGRVVNKMLIISPMIDSRAIAFARENGIKAYGYPEEVELSELQS